LSSDLERFVGSFDFSFVNHVSLTPFVHTQQEIIAKKTFEILPQSMGEKKITKDDIGAGKDLLSLISSSLCSTVYSGS